MSAMHAACTQCLAYNAYLHSFHAYISTVCLTYPTLCEDNNLSIIMYIAQDM